MLYKIEDIDKGTEMVKVQIVQLITELKGSLKESISIGKQKNWHS